MNNRFDFGRFGQMFSLDLKRCIRNFGTSFIVMWCIPIALWIPSLAFNFTMPPFVRVYAIMITVFISTILAPAKIFGDINLRREGIRFALLPASTLEKYLSYALCCTIVPFVVLLGSCAVDSLLTLLPIRGFENYVTFSSFNFTSMFGDPNSGVLRADDNDAFMMFSGIGNRMTLNYFVGLFFNVAFFMFFNLVFRFRNKAGLSFLVMMGFSSIFSVFTSLIFAIIEGSSYLTAIFENAGMETMIHYANQTILISVISNIILTIGLYVASYYRMKSLKY